MAPTPERVPHVFRPAPSSAPARSFTNFGPAAMALLKNYDEALKSCHAQMEEMLKNYEEKMRHRYTPQDPPPQDAHMRLLCMQQVAQFRAFLRMRALGYNGDCKKLVMDMNVEVHNFGINASAYDFFRCIFLSALPGHLRTPLETNELCLKATSLEEYLKVAVPVIRLHEERKCQAHEGNTKNKGKRKRGKEAPDAGTKTTPIPNKLKRPASKGDRPKVAAAEGSSKKKKGKKSK